MKQMLAALILGLCLGTANGAAIYDIQPGFMVTTGSTTRTVGSVFEVQDAITATDLGVFARLGTEGLHDAHMVGLWDLSGSLLRSALVPAGTSAPLDGLFRCAPIDLVVGQQYVIGSRAIADGGAFDLYALSAALFTEAPEISFIEERRSGTLAFTFPEYLASTGPGGTLGFMPANGYFGANLNFVSTVPIPAPALLLTTGLAFRSDSGVGHCFGRYSA